MFTDISPIPRLYSWMQRKACMNMQWCWIPMCNAWGHLWEGIKRGARRAVGEQGGVDRGARAGLGQWCRLAQ